MLSCCEVDNCDILLILFYKVMFKEFYGVLQCAFCITMLGSSFFQDFFAAK